MTDLNKRRAFRSRALYLMRLHWW